VEEESVDQGASVAGVWFAGGCGWGGAGSGVDHHAGGLVDDGEVFVFVEDFEWDVLGDGVERGGLRCAFDLDGFAAVEFLLRLGGVAVDSDLAGFDEELDAGSADVREGLGEVLVEAEIGGGRVGGEGANAGGVGGVGYSGFTVRRRWPLGSMFLDGMGDQLSGLQEKDQASGGDHAEGDPLDGVEEARVGVGLADEGQEELCNAGGREGER
jgi:hypothetical protein